MASKRPKKGSAPHLYSPKPCPSCNPSTKHDCDTCNGTGVWGGSPDHQNCRFPGCDRPIPPGDDFEPDVCEKHRTKELNDRFDDLHTEDTPMQEVTEILVTAIAEDSEDIIPAFQALMSAKLKTKLAERVSLEEVYVDASDHPEVKELIRRGFRLKKSRGNRDVLEGPNGERRVIHSKDGKIHVVSESDNFIDCPECDGSGSSQKWRDDGRECIECRGNGYDKSGNDCESCGGVGFGSVCKNCGGGGTVKGGLRESADKIPCDHCDENGYSQKYKATCRVCKGTKMRSPFRMPEDYSRMEDQTRQDVLGQMRAKGQDRLNFEPLQDRTGPRIRKRRDIKSNKDTRSESYIAEGTHQMLWDKSGEQVGYYGPASEPDENGAFIYGHTPSGVTGRAHRLEDAKSLLKMAHRTYTGKEEELEESVITELSNATVKSYVDQAIDSHANHVMWARERRNLASRDHAAGRTHESEYHDEEGDKEERRANKRKEGILRALNKLSNKPTTELTKEELELFEDPFLTPAKLHKYITFGREDLFNAERSKRDDLNRASRHEDESKEAKTDDDRNFHADRAKKFSASAAMTDKAIRLRKKGLSTAAERLLKSGGRK